MSGHHYDFGFRLDPYITISSGAQGRWLVKAGQSGGVVRSVTATDLADRTQWSLYRCDSSDNLQQQEWRLNLRGTDILVRINADIVSVTICENDGAGCSMMSSASKHQEVLLLLAP